MTQGWSAIVTSFLLPAPGYQPAMADHDVIQLLKDDHRTVQQLFEALGINTGRRDELAQQLVQELTVHTEAEEQIVYPAIRRAIPNGDQRVDEGIDEHRRVSEMLDRLSTMTADDADFDGLMADIQAAVEHHVQEEETETFPLFRDCSFEGERLRLADEVERFKQGGRAPAAVQVSGRAEASFESMTKQELYQRAKEAGIEGRSKMSRDQLVRALQR
jgi:hemerythrin superfamily protein